MKKYYVPGMITLLFLPLVGYFYIQQVIATRDYRGMKINLEDGSFYNCFSEGPFEGVAFKVLAFTGDAIADQELLLQAQHKIETIISQNDQKNGLVFTFGTVPYGTYIKVLNLVENYKRNVFVYSDSIKFSNDKNLLDIQLQKEEIEEMFLQVELENGEIVGEKVVDKVGILLYQMGNYKYAIGSVFVVPVCSCFYSTCSNLRWRKIKK